MSDFNLRDLRALIVCMVAADEQRPLGKKALQKLLYILQKNYSISNGYKFDFYTYGVYSKDLAGDFDLLKSMDVLDIRYIRETRSYEVRRGALAQKYINQSSINNISFKEELLDFIERFGKFEPWELEIISTAVFVSSSEGLEFRKSSQRVHELKPKFEVEEIETVLSKTSGLTVDRLQIAAASVT